MNKILTITEKGQITLPAAARRAMDLKAGDKIVLKYDQKRAALSVTKAPSLSELSKRLTSYINPGISPIVDVDAFYQKYKGKNNG